MKLIYNARLYNLETSEKLGADAVLIHQDLIVEIGETRQLRSLANPSAGLFDAAGCTVLPGLTDAHIHLEHYALGLQKVNCETATLNECLQRVEGRSRMTPPGAWVLGHGWNQNNWPEGYGLASDLDALVPHHPVFLTAKSLHAAWANTAALHLAGISATTPDPEAGLIGRDANGQPNGLLFEAAMSLVGEKLPSPSETQVAEAIAAAQTVLWQFGLTGAHDFDRRRCFAALQILHTQERLRLRVHKSIPLEDLPHAVALGLRAGLGDDWLRIGSVKLFADGALGPRTAAMLQPYENEPTNRGMLMLDAEQIIEHGRLALENGFSLSIHAIGDQANHEVLNAFERLQAIGQARLPHRIEHVQVLHPADVSRLGQMGVIASMQPIHATSDMHMADRYWGERAALSYAWKSQSDHGAVLAFGSDAPVESPNPWWGVHAAVTRQRADGSPGPHGWIPEQRLTVGQALHGFTVGPAIAAGMAGCAGRLAPGFLADLVVLDKNPFDCDPQALKDIRPLATMVGGEWVFRA